MSSASARSARRLRLPCAVCEAGPAMWTECNSHATPARFGSDHDEPAFVLWPPLVAHVVVTGHGVRCKRLTARLERSRDTPRPFGTRRSIGMKMGWSLHELLEARSMAIGDNRARQHGNRYQSSVVGGQRRGRNWPHLVAGTRGGFIQFAHHRAPPS